jgi:hypothetical protein
MRTYYNLDEVEADFGGDSTVYRKCSALFDQGKTTLSDMLIGKVRIAGIPEPGGSTPRDQAEGIANMIEGLREANDDWYFLLTTKDGDELNATLAAWAESTEPTRAEQYADVEDHRKIYVFQTSNKALGISNRRAIAVYTNDLAQHADAALVGNVGPFYPRSVTWKFKRPQGLTVPPLTRVEKDALAAASVNYMTREYKRDYIKEGVMCNGDFIDNQLATDWIALHIRENIYDLKLKMPKVPYSDEGFTLIAGCVFSALDEAASLDMLSRDLSTGAGIYKENRVNACDGDKEDSQLVWR